jgi:hypothetical protein
MLPDGLETSGQRVYRKFWHILSFCVLDDFLHFSKKLGFLVFFVHPTLASVLLSASVERVGVSRMRDFLIQGHHLFKAGQETGTVSAFPHVLVTLSC